MNTLEQPRRANAAHLRIVVRNDKPIASGRPAERDAPTPARPLPARAGNGWYHEEAVRQERAALDHPPHDAPRRGGPQPGWLHRPVGA